MLVITVLSESRDQALRCYNPRLYWRKPLSAFGHLAPAKTKQQHRQTLLTPQVEADLRLIQLLKMDCTLAAYRVNSGQNSRF